jgi:tetratricopeptide (TPR) repeat protein
VDGIVVSFQDFQFTLDRGIRKLFQMLYRRAISLLTLGLVAGAIPLALAWADTPSKEDFFEKGLAAYQGKQYAEARDAFQKQLDQGGISPALLNNLALSVYQLDQKPLALALWRKALSLQPGFKPAALGRDFLERKMNMRPLERDTLSLWIHRNLESLSSYELLWLNALLLVVTGWFGLRYLGERRFALEEEQPLPAFPGMTLIFAVLLVAISSLSAVKFKESLAERATVTGAKVSARSLPADEGVSLFEISGGSEVYVRQQQGGWAQVQNSEGASGWVKDSEIFVTSR